jgi:hypothetical protein
MNARPLNGLLVQGGVNIGRTRTDNCFVVDSPQQLLNCEVRPPFQTQAKYLSTYNLPWDFQVSGTFQSTPGPEITASYVATNAEIAPSLGRNLAQGPNGTATVPLIKPGTLYGERMYQVDARVTRTFTFRGTRIQGMFDLYNVFNDNAVVQLNTAFGPAWQRPVFILPGRLAKFGVQVDF